MNPLQPAVNWHPSPDWSDLRLRAELLRQARAFFHTHHFLEVETPLLSAETVGDAEIEPLSVTLGLNESAGKKKYYLQTSPELCMKRLLAAGDEKALFQVTRAFRGEECGPLHNPEFTIIEWYRVGDTMQDGMHFLSDLFQALMNTREAKALSYREAFLEFTGLDPFATEAAEFAQVATANGLAVPSQLGDDVDEWLDFFLLEMVMPHLGVGTPTILYDYPASQAALAKVREDSIPVAERFELFYQGIELAIRLGLARFDAGAQGEHKLVRGFEPVITHSWHGVMHPGFRDAIERFTSEEAEHVMAYTEDALQALPFRQTEQNQ